MTLVTAFATLAAMLPGAWPDTADSGDEMRSSRWKVASGDADFGPYLDGMPAASVAMFRRFAEMARAGGPVTFELQDGRIVLCGTRRIFASIRVREHGLEGHINLARSVTDRRIRKVEMLTKHLYFHRYLVDAISDLDEEFGHWLREARAIGHGAHLPAGVTRRRGVSC